MKQRFVSVVRLAVVLLVVGHSFLTEARAQDAIVTVYNHGSNWTSGLPGTNHGLFWGCVYDDDVRLNCFREQKTFTASSRNNRFAVFHLPAGQHVFTASYGKHPSQKRQLSLQLEPGKHYYLRAQSESRGVVESNLSLDVWTTCPASTRCRT